MSNFPKTNSKYTYAKKANSEILKWAREKSGLSLQEAAKKIGITKDKLKAVENGETYLTMNQLRKAANVYKRNIAIFFLKEPPEVKQDIYHRITVRDDNLDYNPYLIDLVIRDIYQKKKYAETLYDFFEETLDYSFIKHFSLKDDPDTIAGYIMKILNINHEELNGLKDNEVLKYWKDKVESLNILVFQFQRIEPEILRGFVFTEIPYPTIAINQRDSYYARCFTLLHELCHILLFDSSMCNPTIESEITSKDPIENFCNKVAGLILIPKNLLNSSLSSGKKEIIRNIDKEIKKLSQKFKVSYSVVLFRLYQDGYIPIQIFKENIAKYTESWADKKHDQKGGNYYNQFISSLSLSFIKRIISALNKNLISYYDALTYLGCSARVFNELEKRI